MFKMQDLIFSQGTKCTKYYTPHTSVSEIFNNHTIKIPPKLFFECDIEVAIA